MKYIFSIFQKQGKCWNCGRKGHRFYQCRSNKKRQKRLKENKTKPQPQPGITITFNVQTVNFITIKSLLSNSIKLSYLNTKQQFSIFMLSV